MSNKKNAPDVLRDAARIVGGPDRMKVIENPAHMEHEKINSIPGKDMKTHEHLCGPGKKTFPLKSKSGW